MQFRWRRGNVRFQYSPFIPVATFRRNDTLRGKLPDCMIADSLQEIQAYSEIGEVEICLSSFLLHRSNEVDSPNLSPTYIGLNADDPNYLYFFSSTSLSLLSYFLASSSFQSLSARVVQFAVGVVYRSLMNRRNLERLISSLLKGCISFTHDLALRVISRILQLAHLAISSSGLYPLSRIYATHC